MTMVICGTHGEIGTALVCREIEEGIRVGVPQVIETVEFDDFVIPRFQLCETCAKDYGYLREEEEREEFLDRLTAVCGSCFAEYREVSRRT